MENTNAVTLPPMIEEDFSIKIEYHASAAERWFNCHKSIYLEALLPRDKGSIYAAEGTVAHNLAECAIKSLSLARIQPGDTVRHYETMKLQMLEAREKAKAMGRADTHVINQDGYMITVTDEMFDSVEIYLVYIADFLHQEGADWSIVKVEDKVPILRKKNFIGTLDAYFISPNPFATTVHLFDLKYGKGKFVNAVDNIQLKIYSLGLFGKVKFESIKAHIVQPRINRDKIGAFSEYSQNDMLDFKKFLSKKLKDIEDNPEVCKQGDWCNWCNAKSQCPLLNAIVSNPDMLNLDNKTPKGYKQTWETCLGLEKQIKTIKEEIMEYALSGGDVDGYIIAPGKATRKWSDPALTEKVLSEQFGKEVVMEPRVLKSPAVLEKEIGKIAIEPYVAYVSTTKTLKKKNDDQNEIDKIFGLLN
jgi:hypothetical protein